MASFIIRPASLTKEDDTRLISFIESQITWLNSIGSSSQWGSEPFRTTHPNAPARATEWVRRSESEDGQQLNTEWCRAYIAEAETALGNADATHGLPVAGMVLEAKSAEYVRDLGILPDQDDEEPFLYLSYLMSNREAASALRAGAGSALIQYAKEQAREIGVSRICVDCFAGNERKLVQYYESQGFKVVKDFVAGEKQWPGTVLEMRL